MATTSIRTISISFTGDVSAVVPANEANNALSPGKIDIVTLVIGANTITPPTGGSTPVACTIIPPTSNTATITLKGVTGDTGVVLHKTHSTTIALNSPTSTFVLTVSAEIIGVRLIWS